MIATLWLPYGLENQSFLYYNSYIMHILSTFWHKIAVFCSHFFNYKHYFAVWVLLALVVGYGVYFLVTHKTIWRRYWQKISIIATVVVLVALIIAIPKIRFYYDTRLVLPSYLSAQEKKQFLDRYHEIMTATDNGKNNSGLYNNIGILRSGYKDYTGAVSAFKRAISKNPGDPRFWRNLAISYTNMDKHDLAESAFLESFKLAPTQPEYWLELGQLYSFKIKDNEKARLFYLEAISRNQNSPAVAQAFAQFLENVTKDFHEAIKYWQIVADNVDAKDRLAFDIHIAELKARAGIK